jgi:aarF domain-containing kinase
MAGSWGEDEIEQANATAFTRASSLLDMQPQSEAEMDIVRNTVVQKEGLLTSVFDLLRQIPRRMLMVLKVKWFLYKNSLVY